MSMCTPKGLLRLEEDESSPQAKSPKELCVPEPIISPFVTFIDSNIKGQAPPNETAVRSRERGQLTTDTCLPKRKYTPRTQC